MLNVVCDVTYRTIYEVFPIICVVWLGTILTKLADHRIAAIVSAVWTTDKGTPTCAAPVPLVILNTKVGTKFDGINTFLEPK